MNTALISQGNSTVHTQYCAFSGNRNCEFVLCVCTCLRHRAKAIYYLVCRTGSYREGGLPNTEEIPPHDGESSSDMASGVTHS